MVVLKTHNAYILVFIVLAIAIMSTVASSVVKGELHAEIVAKKKVSVGEPVLFDGSRSTTSTADVLNYSWDVDGDGNADAYDKYFTYIYSKAGTYSVILRVSAGNASDNATATIVVEDVFVSLIPYFGLTTVAIVVLVSLSLYWRKKDIEILRHLKEESIAPTRPMKKKVKKIIKKEEVEKPPMPLPDTTKPKLKKKKIKTEVKATPEKPPSYKEGEQNVSPTGDVQSKVEKSSDETVMCPACGKSIGKYAVICEHCGAVFSDEYVCSSCGATVSADLSICSKCGAKLI